MTLAGYVKCLKRHAINCSISDEDFLNALLKPLVDAGRLKNKNRMEFHLDKSRTSLLLNRQADVPKALRKVLPKYGLYKDVEDNFRDFLSDYIDDSEMETVICEVSEMIQEESQIGNKEAILNKADNPNIFLADALIEAIKLKNDGLGSEGELVRNGSFCVKAIYADIFKYAFKARFKTPRIVVIPVDSEFHMKVTRNYENNSRPEVSAQTIHGQWLTRWEQAGANVSDLPERIRESLKNTGSQAVEGKYPVGTIAEIEEGKTIYYLLVISDFDRNNTAHSTKDNIEEAIEKMANFYDKRGNGYDIYIPLLGTGKSRSNLSLQESYDCILDFFQNHKDLIQGNIYIVIRKEYEKLVMTGGE